MSGLTEEDKVSIAGFFLEGLYRRIFKRTGISSILRGSVRLRFLSISLKGSLCSPPPTPTPNTLSHPHLRNPSPLTLTNHHRSERHNSAAVATFQLYCQCDWIQLQQKRAKLLSHASPVPIENILCLHDCENKQNTRKILYPFTQFLYLITDLLDIVKSQNACGCVFFLFKKKKLS